MDILAKKNFCTNTFVHKIRNFYYFSNPSKVPNSMRQASSNAVSRSNRIIFTKCHILADFRFLAQKGPPVKKLKNQASLYLMNFDYLSYESNLLILGHPHMCERGGALSLYTVFRP